MGCYSGFFLLEMRMLFRITLDGRVVVCFSVRYHPRPRIGFFGLDGLGKGLVETAAFGERFADNRLFPTLEIEPVEALAPQVETAIELDFGQKIVACFGARVRRVAAAGLVLGHK